MTCYSCGQPIEHLIVWLGETYPHGPEEYPFHEWCADQPWPLYEVRRAPVDPALAPPPKDHS